MNRAPKNRLANAALSFVLMPLWMMAFIGCSRKDSQSSDSTPVPSASALATVSSPGRAQAAPTGRCTFVSAAEVSAALGRAFSGPDDIGPSSPGGPCAYTGSGPSTMIITTMPMFDPNWEATMEATSKRGAARPVPGVGKSAYFVKLGSGEELHAHNGRMQVIFAYVSGDPSSKALAEAAEKVLAAKILSRI